MYTNIHDFTKVTTVHQGNDSPVIRSECDHIEVRLCMPQKLLKNCTSTIRIMSQAEQDSINMNNDF